MKKFFTLMTAAMMATSIYAQKEWNFSEWEAKTFNAAETIDGLTVYASSSLGVTIDANNKTVDGVKYTQRLKTGGAGSITEEGEMARILAFDVPGNCTISVIACSSNGSDERTLNYASASFENIYATEIVPPGTPIKIDATYTGEATTIYLYSESGGINFYDIAFTPNGGTDGINEITGNAVADKDAPVYNLAGQRVNKTAKGILIQNGKKFICNK